MAEIQGNKVVLTLEEYARLTVGHLTAATAPEPTAKGRRSLATRADEYFLPGEVAAARAAKTAKRTSPLLGVAAARKPCPVCGKPNAARRFSYLCEDHRDAANLKKWQGKGAKAAPKKAKAKKSAKKSKAPKKATAAKAPAPAAT